HETLDALMADALGEARAALDHDDVPIGALLVRIDDGTVVARRHNDRERLHDPTAHAELLALRDAATAAGSWRLPGHALVCTLEPGRMRGGAMGAARTPLVVCGAPDPRAGALGSLYHLGADPRLNHSVAVIEGIRAEECASLLRDFFSELRGSAEIADP